MTRKLIESTFVTLDGVIGDPQVWGPPYWDDEHTAYAKGLVEGVDALLLGRATYEGFAAAWPSRAGDPFADRLNAMPKHVASRTLRETTWNATVIDGDVASAVAELKRGDGGNLLKYGTGELDRVLLPARLVDELHLWVFPVIAGGGERLDVDVATTHLELLDLTRFRSGIVVLTYGPKD
jgi:dihydrofolate reductase